MMKWMACGESRITPEPPASTTTAVSPAADSSSSSLFGSVVSLWYFSSQYTLLCVVLLVGVTSPDVVGALHFVCGAIYACRCDPRYARIAGLHQGTRS